MHPALTAPEVLDVVFAHMCRSDLVSCALTCRTFTDLCLDRIWRNIPGSFAWTPGKKVPRNLSLLCWTRLFGCFPADLICETDETPLTCLRPPTSKDWERFDYYAKRIRDIEFPRSRTFRSPVFSEDFFEHFQAYFDSPGCERRFILPSLTGIRWKGVRRSEWLGWASFLAPTLRSLDICTCPDVSQDAQTDTRQLVDFLGKQTGRLDFLSLPGFPADCPSLATDLSGAIAGSPGLTYLKIPDDVFCAHDAIRKSIVLHPALKTLVLLARTRSTPPQPIGACSWDDGPEEGVLRTVLLASFESCLFVLRHTSTRRLSGVTVEVGEEPWSVEAFRDIIRLLGERFTSVAHLHITGLSFAELPQPPILGLEELEPLTSLRQLSNLNLMFPLEAYNPALRLDDQEFEKLIRSWPKLRSITLNSYEPKAYDDEGQPLCTPRLTLRSLSSFAQHCPNLKDVTVSVDASQYVGVLSDYIHIPRLKSLNFDDSWITRDTAGLAMVFLASLCVPKSCEFSFRGAEYGPDEHDVERVEQWEGVVEGVNRWREQQSHLLQCAQRKRAEAKLLKEGGADMVTNPAEQ